MDTATVLSTTIVLELKSLRATARALSRPPASVAAALRRMEAELAMPLMQKTGSSLMLTLEGSRLLPRLQELSSLAGELFLADGRPAPGIAVLAGKMLSFDALIRLLHVARIGSIRAAARELGLGQPQLTRQIAHVEAVLGYAVLERGRAGATPTRAGERAVEIVRRIERLWHELTNTADERFRRTETVVRIGSVIPLGPDSQIADLLADLAAGWRLAHPRQPVFISSMIAEELLNNLRRGLFDVVLLDVETLPDDLDGRLLSASPLALVGRASEMDGVRLDDPVSLTALLLRHPVAIPSLRSGLRQKIDPVLEEMLGHGSGRRLEIVEVDSIPVILKLVGRHGFLSILPSVSLAAMGGDLLQISLHPSHSLPLWIAWPKARTGQGLQRQVLELLSFIRA